MGTHFPMCPLGDTSSAEVQTGHRQCQALSIACGQEQPGLCPALPVNQSRAEPGDPRCPPGRGWGPRRCSRHTGCPSALPGRCPIFAGRANKQAGSGWERQHVAAAAALPACPEQTRPWHEGVRYCLCYVGTHAPYNASVPPPPGQGLRSAGRGSSCLGTPPGQGRAGREAAGAEGRDPGSGSLGLG